MQAGAGGDRSSTLALGDDRALEDVPAEQESRSSVNLGSSFGSGSRGCGRRRTTILRRSPSTGHAARRNASSRGQRRSREASSAAFEPPR